MRLMKIPLDHYNDILIVLKLEHYAALLGYFDYMGRKILASHIITCILDNDNYIPTQEQVISRRYPYFGAHATLINLGKPWSVKSRA